YIVFNCAIKSAGNISMQSLSVSSCKLFLIC
ncbi:uncharacterized protein METZ01_LOCUS236721, partial [marine metagenome]